MADRDLEGMKDIEIPAPSADAKARAAAAALSEFRAVKTNHQGILSTRRLTSIVTLDLWRWTMERRMIVGTAAASLVAITVAAQWALDGGYRLDPPQIAKTEIRRDAPRPAASPRPVGERELAKTDAPPLAAPPAAADRLQASAPETRRAAGQTGEADRSGESVATDEVAVEEATVAAAEPAGPSSVEAEVVERAEATAPAPARQVAALPAPAPVRRFRLGPERGSRSVAMMPSAPAADQIAPQYRDQGRDRFTDFDANPVKSVAEEPVSTFSIDVDTAAYAFVRRMLNEGRLPPKDAVRVEEMINYFSYDYPAATSRDEPFLPTVAVYPTPWNPDTKLIHLGIKGYSVAADAKPRANLVFLIDVSGSMQSPDKLPLLKSAFRLLLDSLEAEDTVAIVTYAGDVGTALEPTKVVEKNKILAAIDGLGAGGSTAGAKGIATAYDLAEAEFVEGGVNRVILATDGDFNVGPTDNDTLEEFIERKRKTGVFLSVLGFGEGNYNDSLMQALAQSGNGNAAYIDTLNEARKVLVDEAVSTLVPIAKDVKIQVEFNPATVAEYRLIGYETRALAREDFNNDRVDAGDIGSGHTVTAIYEITPQGSPARLIDDLRYGAPDAARPAGPADEYAFLRLRYKLPEEQVSRLIERPVTTADEVAEIAAASDDMRFAAAVAGFGQKLRGGTRIGDFGYDQIAALATGARGADPFGYRAEFGTLVRLAAALDRSGR